MYKCSVINQNNPTHQHLPALKFSSIAAKCQKQPQYCYKYFFWNETSLAVLMYILCWHLFQYSFRQGMFQHRQVENQWLCAFVKTARLLMHCGSIAHLHCVTHSQCQTEHFQSTHFLPLWIHVYAFWFDMDWNLLVLTGIYHEVESNYYKTLSLSLSLQI